MVDNNYVKILQAWRSWEDGMAMQLVDECLKESCVHSEALRCIHIDPLCAQHQPKIIINK
ncbi:unnamed protein product [Lupinus luteus]|uniref:Uncharacterized protein n=1 Tax=Lupinus luteus TaxID=3873 RepID=A0AAV1VSK0_LUPLU